MAEEISKYPFEANQNNMVILQFVGDISLNGLFCEPQYHADLTKNMEELSEGLGKADLRIGNWESPIWGDGGVNLQKEPRLCTTVDAAKCILPLVLDVALLANNHIYDCLEKGFENTVRFFEKNGINYLGAGTREVESGKPLIITRKGRKVGLLNYAGPETNPSIPAGAGVFLNVIDENCLFAEVADLAAQVDIAVLNLHWGTELVRYPSIEQRRLARCAVEAGAKVVACHHSHCLQGYERWGNGCIFYSLGNFLFGNNGIDESRQWPELSRRTAVATCGVSKAKVEQCYLTYLYQDGLALRWDNTYSRKKQQNHLNQCLKLPDGKYKHLWRREVFWQWAVIEPLRFISTSGGLIKALARLRWKHVVAVFNILTKKA